MIEQCKAESGDGVTVTVDGQKVAKTKIGRSVPAVFSAVESFDAGVDLGSTVSLDYDPTLTPTSNTPPGKARGARHSATSPKAVCI